MRLIDADALFEVIKKSMAENPHKEKTQRAMHIHEHKYFLTLLTTFPTVQSEKAQLSQEGTTISTCSVACSTQDDTISREDALLCLTGIISDMTIKDYIVMVSKRIRNLPPAQSVATDTISRQAAIDAVRDSYDEILDFTSTGRTISDSVEDIISDLPSAQPDIIRCKDCKHKGTKNCVANAWTTIFGFGVKDDFYCGLAERASNE